jgi:hypothetical protein
MPDDNGCICGDCRWWQSNRMYDTYCRCRNPDSPHNTQYTSQHWACLWGGLKVKKGDTIHIPKIAPLQEVKNG